MIVTVYLRGLKKFLVALTAVGVVAMPASAQSTLEKMKTQGAVVGFGADSPWSVVNEDGSMGGALPDMDAAILKEMGVRNIKGEFMEFGAMIPSLLSKRTDFNSSLLNITPERCQAVIFAKPSSCGVETLIVNIERAGELKGYADITARNLKLALIPGGEPMTSEANKAGVPEANRVAFTDYVDAMKLLNDGRVDAVPAADASAVDLMAKFGDPAKQKIVPLYDLIGCSAASFRKDDTELRDAYNVAFDKLLVDGTVAKIMDKYKVGFALKYIGKASAETLCKSAK
ncbi:transporter substrate-binding domain-containing protein [Mesorhizobium sp.]|uniref:transporter substrate-binding domain-containing protein n=1 Tax=Mesorhizobium sp. TaxID=1871066 RepID=UPI000FE37DB2|nr:transporter substrate-binding domain-containing protein [Mesorhizobium sp.]RWN48880.1 MAG: transporter substrate-binding domain-containing protein [Mesorhizobium sp.]RWN69012.1 MAG: transporter substrate-binding domain-containing protein [Mesorhizobium sp.]RWN69592.1 MAG: transporter substrate-binding domain-containing protein [Mesorhizobium sp.]RWN81233.1 MAG: transporter substrate-binding domain-containing protein [Mesorhizobium sp.]RWO05760.1 MAG: transporter substrate-binding domain-con